MIIWTIICTVQYTLVQIEEKIQKLIRRKDERGGGQMKL
jgi:hypothetical protein